MKKLLLTAAAALFSGFCAFAQLQVGAGFLYEFRTDSDALSGLYAGATYNIGIAKGLGIAPGLYYSIANHKEDYTRTTDQALNVPIHFNYGLQAGPGKLFFYAGPTFALGLAYNSKTKVKVTKARIELSGDIDYYKNLDYNRFDVKLGGGVGYAIADHYIFNVGFDYGLLDRSKENDIHFSNLHAGFAYAF